MKDTLAEVTVLVCTLVSLGLTLLYSVVLCGAAWHALGDWPWYAKAAALLVVAPVAGALGHLLSWLTVAPLALAGTALSALAARLTRTPK